MFSPISSLNFGIVIFLGELLPDFSRMEPKNFNCHTLITLFMTLLSHGVGKHSLTHSLYGYLGRSVPPRLRHRRVDLILSFSF